MGDVSSEDACVSAGGMEVEEQNILGGQRESAAVDDPRLTSPAYSNNDDIRWRAYRARFLHSSYHASPEYALLARVLQSRRIQELPGLIREYWRSDSIQGRNRARIVSLAVLPIVAAMASGIIALALLAFSFVAQFILVPAIVSIAFIGYGISFFLGFTSIVLGGACVVGGSIVVSCTLIFGVPVVIMQLSTRERRQRMVGLAIAGYESFRKSFREALRNSDIDIAVRRESSADD